MDYLLHHLFANSVENYPDKIAVMDGRVSLTYTQLSERAGYVAAKLQDAGIRRGDRVAIFLDHNIEQSIAILAISAAGGVFVPISWRLYPDQVEHILKDSGSRILLTSGHRKMSLAHNLKVCPGLEEVLLMEDINGEKTLERSCYTIENDLAALLYTSGSTGRPKGVMLSHKNLIAGCFIVSDYLKLRSSDRLLGIMQLSFDYGLNQLITMLALGGTYRFLQYQFPNDIVQVLKEDEITGFAGLPPVWASLVRSTLAETPLPHLRYITNTGGAVPTQVVDFLKKALPTTEIVLMYGLTEAFRSTYLPPSELENRPTSMGKAIPDTEIFVVSEDGKLCGPNEVGELVHRGPTVSLGYWKRPEETALRFRKYSLNGNKNAIGELVVYSGDLVKRDEEGFLYFVGRKDAMIKCSGVRISPTEIEEVVFRSGHVKEAAAVGIPDPIAGQIIKVFVVPIVEEQSRSSKFETCLIDYCTQYLPRYMVPRHIEIVDSIPKTAHGKVDYVGLRESG